jgi:ABC-2 type transport system ATP-binding protein
MNLIITDGIFALLGPNGAGKSTLMSILATLLEPSDGTAFVDGHDVRKEKNAIRQLLGYLPQDFGLYPVLTAYETLDYMALLCNIHDPKSRHEQIEALLARMNLTEVSDRAVGGFSGGMRQRVGLAQALLNSPKLLIVDEPTAGLDPEERIRVRSLLAELGGERVILLSTHLIEDVEAVADRVAILHRGKVRYVGDVAGMLEEVRGKVWQLDATPDELPGLRDRYLETGLVREGGRLHIRVVADTLDGSAGRPVEPTLEDAYIWLMREEKNGTT